MVLALSEVDARIIGAVAQIIGVVATLLGVAVALWIAVRAEERRRRKRAPRLSAKLARDNYSVCLRIGNEEDKETARNVELLVIDVEHHPINALSQTPRDANLVEQVNQALQWSDGSLRIDIHPGLHREIGVASIRGQAQMPDKTVVGPDVPPVARVHIPRGEKDLDLTVGKTLRASEPVSRLPEKDRNDPARIRLALIADNVNASYYTLEIGWPWDVPWWTMGGRGRFTTALKDEFVPRSEHMVLPPFF